ncbi:hypothetical protein [Dyadobacter sp. 3J3]|uniref:hypothetical protein n=1 Tax=Dyadobacter sp. 3J3 TaxID=2606600 RepID=UPI00190F1D1D|nr:hypothetical protein [Dyadobacter sp. 3J3]
MLITLAGSTFGVWISHGESKFELPYTEDQYTILVKYGYETYSTYPNFSIMPHIKRVLFQWHLANYIKGRKDEVSPWMEAFVNARLWLEK